MAATKLSTGYRYSYRTIMIAFFAFFAPVLSFRDEEDEESGSRSRGWSTHPTTQGENPRPLIASRLAERVTWRERCHAGGSIRIVCQEIVCLSAACVQEAYRQSGVGFSRPFRAVSRRCSRLLLFGTAVEKGVGRSSMQG